jgi:uncharacterized membrane protein
MSTAFFDSSGGNPPIYIDSPTTGEEAPMANRSPSDSFFGNASNNNSDPFLVRQNAFNNFRIRSFSIAFHWFLIILHFTFIMASLVVLSVTSSDVHKAAQTLRFFIIVMSLASAARIFTMIYNRRWPLITVTEWGAEVVQPINTFAGKTAMFFHKNIDLICFLSSVLFMLIMDKQSSEEAEKDIPLLFWSGMIWSIIYFLYFIAPVFFILGLIACLPCIIVILQRFFNFSLVNSSENYRAAPATQAILEKVWKVKFNSDEAFKYINPEVPSQNVFIQKEDTKCSICLGWYEDGDDLRVLPCSHHFHLGCADEWFKITATCPLCVRPIRSENEATPTPPINRLQNPVDSNV